MDKTVVNEREKLFAFLDSEGKQYTHRDISGGYETVYTLPLSLKSKFWDLYCGCLCNSTDAFFDYYDPDETVGRVVTGDTEFTDGGYRYIRKGYDFDGFYKSGESGEYNCKEYIKFHTANIYAYLDPITRRRIERIERDHYAGGEDVSGVTVCFME